MEELVTFEGRGGRGCSGGGFGAGLKGTAEGCQAFISNFIVMYLNHASLLDQLWLP